MDNTTTMEEDKATPRTVMMYPDQWALVEDINEQQDLRSLSHALRFVVNEYRRMKEQLAMLQAN